MPIKQKNAISKQDFEEALDYLGSSISEVSKESGIPRAYLSELKNRNTRLRREYEEKLRAFLQQKEIEFEDGAPPAPAAAPQAPHSDLRQATTTRCYFPVDEALDDGAIEQAMLVLVKNDARLISLLGQKATRASFFLGVGDAGYSDETKAALKEIADLCATNYVLFRKLCGWLALSVTPAKAGDETLRDAIIAQHRVQLIEAGFVLPEAEPAEEVEAEAAA